MTRLTHCYICGASGRFAEVEVSRSQFSVIFKPVCPGCRQVLQAQREYGAAARKVRREHARQQRAAQLSLFG